MRLTVYGARHRPNDRTERAILAEVLAFTILVGCVWTHRAILVGSVWTHGRRQRKASELVRRDAPYTYGDS